MKNMGLCLVCSILSGIMVLKMSKLVCFSEFLCWRQRKVWSTGAIFYNSSERSWAYSRKYGYACGVTKKGQESPVKEHSFGFLPLIFANLEHLERQTPLNGMCFGGFSREKGISFLKKGTACGYRTQ